MTGWLVFLMFAGMLLVGLAPAWRVAPLPGRPWLVSVPGLLVLSGMLAVLVTQLLGQGGLVSVWQALGSAGLLAAALLAFVMLAYTLVRPSMLALQYSRTPQEKALDIEDVESRALVLLPVGRVFAHGDRRLFLLLCLGCMVLILWQFVDGLPTDPVLREQVAWGLLGVALLAAASLLVLVVQPWGILLVQPQNREDAEAFYLLVMMVFVPLAGRAGATLPTMLESAGGAAILLMLFCALMCFVSLLRFRRQARRGNAMLCYLGSVLLMLLDYTERVHQRHRHRAGGADDRRARRVPRAPTDHGRPLRRMRRAGLRARGAGRRRAPLLRPPRPGPPPGPGGQGLVHPGRDLPPAPGLNALDRMRGRAHRPVRHRR